MSTIIGKSFCGGCDRYVETWLTGYNKPCDCCIGGRLWEVSPDQHCICGARQAWLHEPPPEPLEWTIELPQKVTQS